MSENISILREREGMEEATVIINGTVFNSTRGIGSMGDHKA